MSRNRLTGIKVDRSQLAEIVDEILIGGATIDTLPVDARQAMIIEKCLGEWKFA